MARDSNEIIGEIIFVGIEPCDSMKVRRILDVSTTIIRDFFNESMTRTFPRQNQHSFNFVTQNYRHNKNIRVAGICFAANILLLQSI